MDATLLIDAFDVSDNLIKQENRILLILSRSHFSIIEHFENLI